jgi:hypothetical protein
MINSTLAGMRIDIKKLVKNSLVLGNHDPDSQELVDTLPIAMDNNVSPYCKDVEMNSVDSYEDLYSLDSISKPEYNIVKMLEKKGVKLNKCIFVVFTVIVLTAEKNNPPNPPYVNTNNLLIAQRTGRDDIIKTELRKFIENLIAKKYNFYENFIINSGTASVKLEEFLTIPKYQTDMGAIRSFTTSLIDLLTKINAATLIGTLMATDELQNITYDKNICKELSPTETVLSVYNQDKTNEEKPYIPLSINIIPQPIAVKNKYLKYKNKYLALKEKLRNRQ